MNTIIIHPNNRVARTPAHDLSAALIAPVSPWYRKPTPWWIEEVRLHPISETDETLAETEGDDIANQLSASSTDIALQDSQQGPDIIENIASDDIIFGDDFHAGMEKDGCYDFCDKVILVAPDLDSEDEGDDDIDNSNQFFQ